MNSKKAWSLLIAMALPREYDWSEDPMIQVVKARVHEIYVAVLVSLVSEPGDSDQTLSQTRLQIQSQNHPFLPLRPVLA